MGDYETNRVFAENLRKYMDRNGESQGDLSRFMRVAQSTISYWLAGLKTPRMPMIDRLCEHYRCTRSDLLEEKHTEQTYYTDESTRKIAQEIFESKEMRGLFYAAKDLSPEKLRLVQQLCKQLKETNV